MVVLRGHKGWSDVNDDDDYTEDNPRGPRGRPGALSDAAVFHNLTWSDSDAPHEDSVPVRESSGELGMNSLSER